MLKHLTTILILAILKKKFHFDSYFVLITLVILCYFIFIMIKPISELQQEAASTGKTKIQNDKIIL